MNKLTGRNVRSLFEEMRSKDLWNGIICSETTNGRNSTKTETQILDFLGYIRNKEINLVSAAVILDCEFTCLPPVA